MSAPESPAATYFKNLLGEKTCFHCRQKFHQHIGSDLRCPASIREVDFKAGYLAGYDAGSDRGPTFSSLPPCDPNGAWKWYRDTNKITAPSLPEGPEKGRDLDGSLTVADAARQELRLEVGKTYESEKGKIVTLNWVDADGVFVSAPILPEGWGARWLQGGAPWSRHGGTALYFGALVREVPSTEAKPAGAIAKAAKAKCPHLFYEEVDGYFKCRFCGIRELTDDPPQSPAQAKPAERSDAEQSPESDRDVDIRAIDIAMDGWKRHMGGGNLFSYGAWQRIKASLAPSPAPLEAMKKALEGLEKAALAWGGYARHWKGCEKADSFGGECSCGLDAARSRFSTARSALAEAGRDGGV